MRPYRGHCKERSVGIIGTGRGSKNHYWLLPTNCSVLHGTQQASILKLRDPPRPAAGLLKTCPNWLFEPIGLGLMCTIATQRAFCSDVKRVVVADRFWIPVTCTKCAVENQDAFFYGLDPFRPLSYALLTCFQL